MSLLKSEKSKSKYFDKFDPVVDDKRGFNRSGCYTNQLKLSDIEDKIKMFGGLEEM
jgi:hypothetical protein